jgi:hypothetical protein
MATILVVSLSGCEGKISGVTDTPPPGGSAGSGAGIIGPTTGAGGGGGTGPVDPGPCSGDPVLVQKRMIRLSFNQVMTTIRSLLGNTIADKIVNDPVYAADLLDAKHRGFPPLASPREGSVITDATWATGDQIAQATAQYVLDNFATVTKCTTTGTALDTCAQTWLRTLAAAAWRRPLTAAETTSFNQLYTDLKDTTKVGVTTRRSSCTARSSAPPRCNPAPFRPTSWRARSPTS